MVGITRDFGRKKFSRRARRRRLERRSPRVSEDLDDVSAAHDDASPRCLSDEPRARSVDRRLSTRIPNDLHCRATVARHDTKLASLCRPKQHHERERRAPPPDDLADRRPSVASSSLRGRTGHLRAGPVTASSSSARQPCPTFARATVAQMSISLKIPPLARARAVPRPNRRLSAGRKACSLHVTSRMRAVCT